MPSGGLYFTVLQARFVSNWGSMVGGSLQATQSNSSRSPNYEIIIVGSARSLWTFDHCSGR